MIFGNRTFLNRGKSCFFAKNTGLDRTIWYRTIKTLCLQWLSAVRERIEKYDWRCSFVLEKDAASALHAIKNGKTARNQHKFKKQSTKMK